MQNHDNPRTVITKKNLPLSCPRKQVWNQHPKVFLKLDHNNKALCPYCGTLYQLQTKSE